jgi:hypothetical protein
MLSISEIERYFQSEPPNLLEIILELRNLIFMIAPDATEMIQWKGVTYFDANRGGSISAGICQIHVVNHCVHLSFIHGKFLPDTDTLLEGSQKYKRYVRICSFDNAPWESLKKLIQASKEFDPYTLKSN